MDALAQFRQTFFEECSELLAVSESGLAALAEGNGDPETLHSVFRAIHSIKGGAGAFGFTRLVRFAHVLETLLDRFRDAPDRATPRSIATLIRANDMLADLVRAAQEDIPLADGLEGELVHALDALAADDAQPRTASFPHATSPSAARSWRIVFEPDTGLLRKANEPLLLLRELASLGDATVTCHTDRLPKLGDIRPEDAYLAWTITLTTDRSRDDILAVFEFVGDDCRCDVEEISREDASDDEEGFGLFDPPPEAFAPPGSAGPAIEPPRTVPQPTTTSSAPPPASIRVELSRVDRLVNLVGELVTTQAMLSEQIGQLPPERFPILLQGLDAMLQHTREMQESVMAIRAQPVKSVFARIPKLVRELAATLGKDVRLVTAGENTEIDKTVIEQLGDPLTHMIRNAIDHGLETPEERAANGKVAQGTIQLSAEHRSGRIVIGIADDGRGIDRARVLEKAREKGLVAPTAQLSDEEIDNLIFLPGFSTASKISDVSGRGVGMDVVKRNLQALGGRVSIASTPGQGSRFSLSLPLTLAVLDGMIVEVGEECYVVPITSIIESLRPRPQDIHRVTGAGDVLAIRGEYVPLSYLHRRFDVPGAVTDPSKGIVVMIDTDEGGKLGIVVDELLGQQQVVIKSLEAHYKRVDGAAAATILGNGRVALILDVAAFGAGTRPMNTGRSESNFSMGMH